MKTLAFGASGSISSINQVFASYTAQKLNPETEIISITDYTLPLYSIDEEIANGIPENAKLFYQKIKFNDLIIISLAEHNGSYTAIFKNLFDWLSRIELSFFADKKLVLLATAPGPRGGLSVMETAQARFPRHGATILGSFSLPKFQENFDMEDKKIKSEEWKDKFNNFVNEIKNQI
ncbi:MAG: NADPH-dependent FMN reductase [Fusobacteriaceae bacterium]